MEDIFSNKESHDTVMHRSVKYCIYVYQMDAFYLMFSGTLWYFSLKSYFIPRIGGVEERRDKHPRWKEELVTQEERCD